MDNSGTFKWVADELQLAELRGEKVWLVSHIPAGFSGRSVLPNPSDLLQAIVARYSPHVIVATFNGHTHEDALFLTYANNGTVKTVSLLPRSLVRVRLLFAGVYGGVQKFDCCSREFTEAYRNLEFEFEVIL